MSPKRVKAEKATSEEENQKTQVKRSCDADAEQYKTDEFRMYCLKVLPCNKHYSHDWTICPFSHPKEKALRRDPRKINYTGVVCPDVKQGKECPRNEHCPFAHNVFEYWLHPSRYRTQLCNIATSCNRKICFFAHSIEELRVPTPVGNPEAMVMMKNLNPQFMIPNLQQYTLNHSTLNLNKNNNITSPFITQNPDSTTMEALAKELLRTVMNARQVALQRDPLSGASADFAQINTLLNELRSINLGPSNILDHSTNRPYGLYSNYSNLSTIENLFSALCNEIYNQFIPENERNRLLKLLHWIYIQVYKNRQSVVGSSTMDSISNSNVSSVPQTDADSVIDTFRRHSLSSLYQSSEGIQNSNLQIPQRWSYDQPRNVSSSNIWENSNNNNNHFIHALQIQQQQQQQQQQRALYHQTTLNANTGNHQPYYLHGFVLPNNKPQLQEVSYLPNTNIPTTIPILNMVSNNNINQQQVANSMNYNTATGINGIYGTMNINSTTNALGNIFSPVSVFPLTSTVITTEEPTGNQRDSQVKKMMTSVEGENTSTILSSQGKTTTYNGIDAIGIDFLEYQKAEYHDGDSKNI